ncbi:hypothetical protein [Thermococcus sp.]|uniref:hypothetical protein n=1 Tax=Thermococcus sp. TaxID=35749 RepID=UPI002624DE7C|nr:hypothetical protein [Thermococcus sp.]
MTEAIFPSLLYYRGGRLLPVVNISVEAFNQTPVDGERFLRSWPVMKIQNESRAEFGGSSSLPELELPRDEEVYYPTTLPRSPSWGMELSCSGILMIPLP